MTKTIDEFTMPGSRVRETHSSTVLSIVGRDRMIPVVTRGTGFSMKGAFGWRSVAARFARGERDPRQLASITQYEAGTPAQINIAECGDDVPRRTYLALIGGAAHESFHRLYSQQGALEPSAIAAALRPATNNPSVDWSKRSKLVLDLQNVCEDIAIERLGCAEFPGVVNKLADLADYIVRMEAESRARAGNPPATVVQTVFVAWRDLGLGYNTPTLRDNLARLARECPEGLAMLRPGGALHDVFVRSVPDVRTPAARERAKQALLDGSALTLALEAVAHLEGAASAEEPQPPQSGKGPQGGKGPVGELGQGRDVTPGKGEGPKGPKGDKPEGADAPNAGPGEGDKPDADKDGEGEGNGAGPEGDKPEAGNGAGEGDQPGDPSDADAPGEGTPRDGTNTREGEGSANGAGGGEGTSTATAKDFLDQHAKDGKSGTLDSNSALEAGVKADQAEDLPAPNDYTSPMPYRPYSTAHDETVAVRPSKEHAASFTTIANAARKGTSYLRTRLAVLFRALENSGTEHGVRKGSALSPRMLVDSYCEMQGGAMPTRAYMERTPAMDMSIAAALVIDESSSMRDKLRETCAIAYTLLDALDGIGAKSMAMGFRTKSYDAAYASNDYTGANGCHRTHAMYYDLFKGWSETFKASAPRLREIKAAGGTPMSDGIEFALRELSARKEGHRILFVLTDGEPDGQHARVIPTQLQRAAEAGVLVIGVGLGYGSEGVKTRFPDHVYARDLTALPAALVRKLEELVRTRHAGAKRGRTVKAA